MVEFLNKDKVRMHIDTGFPIHSNIVQTERAENELPRLDITEFELIVVFCREIECAFPLSHVDSIS